MPKITSSAPGRKKPEKHSLLRSAFVSLFLSVVLVCAGLYLPRAYTRSAMKDTMIAMKAAAGANVPESSAFSASLDIMETKAGYGLPTGEWEHITGNRFSGSYISHRISIIPDGRFVFRIALYVEGDSGKMEAQQAIESVGLVSSKGRVLRFKIMNGPKGLLANKGRVGVMGYDFEKGTLALAFEAGESMPFELAKADKNEGKKS